MADRERPQNRAPVRHRPPGVIPVELWDLELHTGILWDHMNADSLTEALAEALGRLTHGTARTRSHSPLPPTVGEFAAVWVTGGRANTIDVGNLATRIQRPVWRADEPATVAVRGARALAPHAQSLIALDLGQSHLKIFAEDQPLVVPRPWDRLPMRDQTNETSEDARRSLRTWVVEALAPLRHLDPDTVIVALPCELGDDPTPRDCSYAGLRGDVDFVPHVIAAAGWRPAQLWVLNDAELAATAARLDPRTHRALTLVLTLGFGVGAALLRP